MTFLMGQVFLTIFNKIRRKQIFFTSWKKYPIFEELSLGNYWIHKVRLGLKLSEFNLV
jgi:hypothetical protein